MGADGVELDVHESADGLFLVHHDPEVPDDPPRLEEALEVLDEGGHVVVFVEVKSLRDAPGLLRTLAPWRGKLDLRPMSFDLAIVKSLAGDFPLGVIANAPGTDPVSLLDGCRAGLLSLREDAIDAALVETLHATGRELFAWTVNDPGRMRALAALGVDGLISDHPDRVAAVIQSSP